MRTGMMIGALAAVIAGAGLAGAQQGAAGPPAQATAPGAQKVRGFKSQAEGQALQGMVQAATPEARIAAAEDFVTKFPDSDFKALALAAEAQSYQQKNDYERTVIYGERALDANPDPGTRLQTQLMLAKVIALRTREFDLDREEKLGRVEKYANGALEMLSTMAKPNPNLSDEQWNTVKADMIADAHDSLGVAALVRKNYSQAESEFKTSVAAGKTPDAATQVRLAATYNKESKYDDAIALCDKLMAEPNLHPAIRSIAQAERARAIQSKNGGQKPAAAPADSAPAAQPAPAAPKP